MAWAVAALAVGPLASRRCRAEPPPVVDCRYAPAAGRSADGGLEGRFLPSNDIFRPLLADNKEPRFSAAIQRVKYDPGALATQATGQGVWAAVVGLGTDFGIYRWRTRHGCDGIQIGLAGGVFSQFNLDGRSVPLINSDFTIGMPVTVRSGPFSARLQVYHQSSHLGDEFLLNNPQIDRIDLGYEVLEALASLQDGWWRAYIGGGYIIHSQTDPFEPGELQAGVELRARPWQLDIFGGTHLEPTLGLDATSWQNRDWGITFSTKAGVSARTDHNSRHVRLLVVFLRGFYPFGQFFDNEQLTNYGLEAQLEY